MQLLATTAHAEARIRQRGIPIWVLDLLFEHGKARHDGRGGELVTFPKRCREKLRRMLPRTDYAAAERYFNVYAVVSSDGVLVTAGHRTRRLPLN